MYDTAIYIGRFEPVHNGHMALLQRALDSARNVIVVMGSAWQARSPKNPFTCHERADMMLEALTETDRARVQVLPMRDYYNEALWVQAVRKGVGQIAAADAHVGLVGHFKDATSSYLSAFPGWELIHVERQGRIDATAIRDAYFGATPGTVRARLSDLASQMPESTLGFLERFAQTPCYPALQEEWRMLRGYREAWAAAPYPPVFVTVDAVLRCQNHVLLIRRAHAPGKGQRAVPGGFIEQRETVWQSCLRELAEETHCELPESHMRDALQSVAVFDHPDRSQRGRTITHAHYFDLGDAPFPAVRADDDAMQVEWVPVEKLAAMEEEFFEDHFHMLDHFLVLTTPP
ncbi:bifunctional nicotinamide-nucleotide adenylyltransferase/Nudix hydroxylase [Acidovorax sp. JHL-3]|mgnify:FL=1|jgi:bifunctional NMN adenylyltransferase/nudix hydrolase|uniref:bifunctional nicotinamide-nucleotide adenylyltransferase/Nudix hydroxylase n=1 Tax=Acidovorax sp. JHL-3 TaxID=1276755 RepID=UPI000466F4F3|nr:bifunctional nicotinamide-nucleotide adenylyltransferase/Nudix hydroxylase [Acidovorax sp. JHL-3]MBP7438625.1 bifunctional nicotinamide-nucleotide adenylyltransferase/Nudix hydroxylase [Acidovorax sp.]